MDLAERRAFAEDLAERAGAFALAQFKALDSLVVETKGRHDLVSQADRETETFIRDAIEKRWPDDGIVGEEHGRLAGKSGFDWVIDPIDGTANFVTGIPHWCVVIACAHEGHPVVGAICDPNTGELFSAARGLGATVNGRALSVSSATSLSQGSVATGASGRTDREQASAMVRSILIQDGMFFRSASGALMLAYVASGRLIGYIEDHMNSWDCFAALVMIVEAGGVCTPLDDNALLGGTRLVAGTPGVHPVLQRISDDVFPR